MYEKITPNNVLMYAIRNYNNPHCEGEKEFEDDLKRFKYIKRLLRKYYDTDILKERLLLKNETIPVIPDHVRFEFNEVRKEWVLLAPERALYPDPIATEVLKKCDGKISIQLIGEDLAKKYKAPVEKIVEDVIKMLQDLADKGFLKEC